MADTNDKFSTRIKKKPMPTVKKVTPQEKATKKITEEPKKEITKRLTIDLPHSAYIALKMHVLKQDITAKGYIKELIMRDLDL